jgi:uncharacterized phage protein (TIGR01671 family)
MSDKRDIQFRAWDIKGKHILNVGALDWHWSHIAVYAEAETLEWRPDMDVDCVLMQLTGLKDRNGKDIYEGDIVRRRGEATGYEVVWDPSDTGFYGRSAPYNGIPSASCQVVGLNNAGVSLEVIGNIHENPELLRKEVKEAPSHV